MFKTNRINKNDVSWDPTSSSVPWKFQVILNGSMIIIDIVFQAKFLGVIVDPVFRFDTHVLFVVKKLS